MTEVKAAQYESEKSFRTKLAELSKKSSESVDQLQVSLFVRKFVDHRIGNFH